MRTQQGGRRSATLAAVALAGTVAVLKLTWPHWQLDLPGEKPLPARWDPDLAVVNAFNSHQQELGADIRMTRADCDEMGSREGSVGTCVVHLSDGSTDTLTLTMLEDGEFDIQVQPED